MTEDVFGGYRALAKLGEGGMGEVYRAEHIRLGKPCALKVLRKELASNEQVVARFFNEAVSASKVKHSGVVDIYDYGHRDDGTAYIVMELLEGETLGDKLEREGALRFSEVTTIVYQVASILQCTSDVGIIHRDLKPENIFLCKDSFGEQGLTVKILDFGIAKLNTQGAAGSLTRTGTAIGTPKYMSPEQCAGSKQIDLRSDLYALGCVAYELVTGKPPFAADGLGEMFVLHMQTPPVRPSEFRPDLPPELESIVLRLLAKSADDRLQSGREVAEAIDSLTGGALKHSPRVPADLSSATGRQTNELLKSPDISTSETTSSIEPSILSDSDGWTPIETIIGDETEWEWTESSGRPWMIAGGSLLLVGLLGWGVLQTFPTIFESSSKEEPPTEIAVTKKASPASDGSAVNEVAPSGPLSEKQREIFWGSDEDDPPEVLNAFRKENYGTHFLTSDEMHQHLFADRIEGIGGGFVGVGTDQCWLFLGWQKPSLAWLADYDTWVVAMQWIYVAFFEVSETSEEFVQRWNKDNKKDSRALLARRFGDHPDRDLILRVFDNARHLVAIRLRRVVRMGEKEKPNYLTSDAQYQYVRALVNDERVRPLLGDLNGEKGITGLSAAARELGVTIRHLYISNVEDYWSYRDVFRENVHSLPIDDQSVVSRTRASKRTNGDFRYMQQPLGKFSQWLSSGIRRSREMWLNRSIEENEFPYTWFKNEPPRR